MRRRRAFGFTLVELLVAMALAGLVVGGALQMHASFNKQTERQNEVAEMQQNLRVSMLIIERAIRSAGFGIPGGMLPEYGSGSGCGGATRTHYGFEWSNSNTYTDPIVVVSQAAKPSATTNDPDPDYFWVISGDSSMTPVYGYSDAFNTSTLTLNSATTLAAMSHFIDHDLFVISLPTGTNTCTVAGVQTDCANLLVPAETPTPTDYLYGHCIREASTGTKATNSASTHVLLHDSTKSSYCFNRPNSYTSPGDPCLNNFSAYQSKGGVQIRRIPSMATAYRIMTTSDSCNTSGTGGTGGPPKLVTRTAAIGTGANCNWNIIAENIDDMQIAVIAKNGMVCNQVNDPTWSTGCDISTATAVRVTLSARSSSKVAGLSIDTTPLAEDHTSRTDPTVAGYLHRSLTAEIELRNMGRGVNP